MFENNVVVEYLEKCRDSLMKEKNSLEIRKKDIEQKINEIITFREVLEKKNDPNFEILTPYVVNLKNKEKIEECKIKEEKNKEKLKLICEQLEQKENQYQELIVVIEQAKNLKKFYFELQDNYKKTINESNDFIKENLNKIVLEKLKKLTFKISLCLDLLNVDTVRCKVELNNIIDLVYNIQNDLQQFINSLYNSEINYNKNIVDENRK